MGWIKTIFILLPFIISISNFLVDEPIFDFYKETFEIDTGVKIPDYITITFATRRNPIAGQCFLNIPYVIAIDPTVWFNKSYIEKKALIYHELSHCVCFRLLHTSGEMEDGCPKSLMSKNMASKKCYEKHWDYYMTEFCLDKSKKL